LLARINPRLVFFHTAQGNIVRELGFLLPRRYKFIGVHHNADKLIRGRSFSQNLISRRMKHYFVLADYVKENLLPLIPRNIFLEDVYTVYYDKPEGFREIPKTRKLRVAIPGAVEQSRRDFFGLLEALKKYPLSPEVEFVVLGNGRRGEGPALREQLKAAGLESHFTFFDAYVSAADMASYMASSDVLLPLMHPGMKYFTLFSQYKISGTYNWAYGYKKPMLMHQELHRLKTFHDVSIGYDMETLVETLNTLAQDPTPLAKITQNIQQDPRFDFAHQKRKYSDFVEKALE
jgi:glycosyltransferase involved in cell wall biosynthesis